MSQHFTFRVFYLMVWIARAGALAMVITLALVVDTTLTEQHRVDLKQRWQASTDELSLSLQAAILQNVQTVWGLAANVAVEPNIDGDRFEELARVIFNLAPSLRNIGLAPDLTIRYVYPFVGNESAVGLDLTSQSLPHSQINALKETRKAIFTGPIKLVQGGTGLASRIPIFTEKTGDFWGVVSVILNLEDLYKTAGLENLQRDMRFVLSTSDTPDETSGIFFGPRNTQWSEPVSSTLSMPGTQWTVFAEPAESWPTAPKHSFTVRLALLMLSSTILAAVFWLTSLMLKDREMQMRFWGLFELSPMAVALFNAKNGRLIRANPEFEDRFGRDGSTLDFFEQGFQADGSALSKPLGLRNTLRRAQSIKDLQTYYPLDDNSVAPVRLRGLALPNAGSEPVIWLMAEDISDQKKVERMKNEFISTVSHELRTPLTSISGSLALLANDATGALSGSTARMINIAHRNSLQLTNLINDLLDIDKLAAGKMQFQIERIPVAGPVEEAVENISQYINENKVCMNLAQIHDAHILADRQRLGQALNNLLSNAIKFSPRGGTVHVYSQIQNNVIRVCVRDEGEGVPENFRQRMFEKFSQADGSSRRSKAGTGLGLAITRELMHHMGGSVDFESTAGQGATFWLEFPLADEKTR